MKNLIPGYKTNINTIALALIPILGLAGIQVDPEATTKLINDFGDWIQLGFGILGAAGIYFRSLANNGDI